MASNMHSKRHAIMISVPYQGHITPFVNLALKIASSGFAITFVHTEYIHHTLSKVHKDQLNFFSKAREAGLDICYTTISDGFPLEFDRTLHLEEFWESMFYKFPCIADEFVGKMIMSDPHSVHFLVTDTTFSWTAKIASKYNLVNVSFWTEPALVFSLGYHLDLLQENGHYPAKDDAEEQISYVPGVDSISTKDLMPYLKESESTTLVHQGMATTFKEVKKADFVLHNTVQELESDTLSSLNHKNQPNYAVGPISFLKNATPIITTVPKSLWAEADCNQWLETKRPGSVVYVSFGSLVQISKQVIEEIAYGIILSEVNFIWVFRDDHKILPHGFEDAFSEDRGLIIPWCDQISVLSHPAVGGFFTHCGWNSILESIWCGVPMICYPITFDQPTNRKLVVDDWKIGTNLCDGLISVQREAVAEKINSFINGGVAEDLRNEITSVKEKLHNAVEINGSSNKNFDKFICDLKKKLMSYYK
ncbi:UDP-glycosyltransferase 86A1-like [Primulina huaijiensis]|uniref:UDP-glycosyltransferase 86A1-like n=1 Tax=Primulina huaijiensis TaxID=1492673 RepID=UPI003CC72029